MAEIANKNALTVSDGLLNFLNIDTVGDHAQLTNDDLSLTQSATAVAIATNGTIATAGIVVSRLNPAGAVTGIILAAGTQPGQVCLVVNEAAAADSVTFNATPGTSNVADSANEQPIYGLQARLFAWDSGQSLWYPIGNPLNAGTFAPLQSGTAVAIASTGAIATNVGVSRLAPAGAVTGITMTAGTVPGQLCLVVNESVAADSITFNATPATANVADSANVLPIYGLQSRLFVWDSGTSLWYEQSALNGGTLTPLQSATAVAIASSGTIATANLGVSRLSPAAAVTGIILAAGTIPGQLCLVVNEAVQANSVTFNATPGTANVADSANEQPIYGLQARLFVWDSGASLWYPVGNGLTGGTLASLQSATAVVLAGNGAIATAGIGVSRINAGASVTGITMQAGTIPGQEVWVINEDVVGHTITFNTTPATALVANSATASAIAGLTARKFVWDSGTSLWYATVGT